MTTNTHSSIEQIKSIAKKHQRTRKIHKSVNILINDIFPKICDVLLKTPLVRDIQFLLCHKMLFKDDSTLSTRNEISNCL